MKSIGAIVFVIVTSFSLPLTAQVAKGRVISDLSIGCRGVNETGGNLDLNLTVEVKGDLYRLRSSTYTTKVKTTLFEITNELATEAGITEKASFYPAYSTKLSLNPIHTDATNFSYSVELPKNAIYPTDNEYDAVFTRSNFRMPSLNKTVGLKCKTRSKVTNFEFPYISASVLSELDKDKLQWRFLAYVAETPTSDLEDYLNYPPVNGLAVSAQEEEKLVRWAKASRVLESEELENLSEAEQNNVKKLQKDAEQLVKDAWEEYAENSDWSEEELEAARDNGNGAHAEVQVVVNKQKEVLGYILKYKDDGLTDDYDNDAGYDVYYNAAFEEIGFRDWSY